MLLTYVSQYVMFRGLIYAHAVVPSMWEERQKDATSTLYCDHIPSLVSNLLENHYIYKSIPLLRKMIVNYQKNKLAYGHISKQVIFLSFCQKQVIYLNNINHMTTFINTLIP